MITGFYLNKTNGKYHFKAKLLRGSDYKLTGEIQYICRNCATNRTTIVDEAYYNAGLKEFKKSCTR